MKNNFFVLDTFRIPVKNRCTDVKRSSDVRCYFHSKFYFLISFCISVIFFSLRLYRCRWGPERARELVCARIDSSDIFFTVSPQLLLQISPIVTYRSAVRLATREHLSGSYLSRAPVARPVPAALSHSLRFSSLEYFFFFNFFFVLFFPFIQYFFLKYFLCSFLFFSFPSQYTLLLLCPPLISILYMFPTPREIRSKFRGSR